VLAGEREPSNKFYSNSLSAFGPTARVGGGSRNYSNAGVMAIELVVCGVSR